ncbi:MAG: response regulator [Caulobacterales bacterium]
MRDPQCRVLAVVEGELPIGLILREPFMARMEAAGAIDRPITEVMDRDPLIGDAGQPIGDFIEQTLLSRLAGLEGGFVVTQDGAYVGVGDASRLIVSLMAPQGEAKLIERICGEVREPIAHALAAAEGLRRLRLPEAAAGHLETITDAGHSTLALLDAAVELQKAEAGRLEILAEPRRLQELMDDIEARWRHQAENAGVTLLVSYDGQPDCVAVIDRARLLQVFDALIGHALAHVRHGVIEASLQARQGSAGIELTGRVRDNGAQYAPDYLAHMFRGASDAVGAGGMGIQLGLMLAERAIAVMRGRLVAKANIGPGATVVFELNAEASEAALAESPASDTGRTSRSAHVLVVDDNATNRMVVEALCEMFDCSTESVVDGVEAVEAAKAGRFDVILMDIKMPRMDGVTATREIRKLSGSVGRVPIIALTANADPDEVAEYLSAGMRCVVEKPIKPERLMEALDGALADSRPAQGAAAA